MPTPSLKELCILQSAQLILASFETMKMSFGNSGEHPQVDELQEYLIERLGKSINDVCAKAHELLPKTVNAKLLFALEMHKYVQTFVFRDEVMFRFINTDYAFWGSQLGKLTNVTELDIRTLQCTDEMINAISENCLQLEVFRFDAQPRFPLFTWLRDQQGLVTSEGVTKLLKLDKLRVVDDASHFQRFFHEFLKPFFGRLLPRLENFSHENLEGFVLNNLGDLQTLQLTDLTLHSVAPQYVLQILKLCPKLNRLCLLHLYGGIFDDLTNSSVNVTNFYLDNFSADYMPGLCHFLLFKGDALTHLNIRTDAIIRINDLIIIGECCLNLQHFGMELTVRRIEGPYLPNQVSTDIPIFKKLTSLALRGVHCDFIDQRIVDLFLKYHTAILSLALEGQWIALFEHTRKRLFSESMMFPNLTTLSVWINLNLPDETEASLVKHLYRSPKLKFFHVYSNRLQYKTPSTFWDVFLEEEKDPAHPNVRYMNTRKLGSVMLGQ